MTSSSWAGLRQRSTWPVAPLPGRGRPGLAAGLLVAVNRGHAVTAVPPGAGAGGALPVGPREDRSGLAACALAGAAPAERCHPDRHQPEDEASDTGENQADDSVSRAQGAEGEHPGQGKDQAHVNDGFTQRGRLQWTSWRVAGFARRPSSTMYPGVVGEARLGPSLPVGRGIHLSG